MADSTYSIPGISEPEKFPFSQADKPLFDRYDKYTQILSMVETNDAGTLLLNLKKESPNIPFESADLQSVGPFLINLLETNYGFAQLISKNPEKTGTSHLLLNRWISQLPKSSKIAYIIVNEFQSKPLLKQPGFLVSTDFVVATTKRPTLQSLSGQISFQVTINAESPWFVGGDIGNDQFIFPPYTAFRLESTIPLFPSVYKLTNLGIYEDDLQKSKDRTTTYAPFFAAAQFSNIHFYLYHRIPKEITSIRNKNDELILFVAANSGSRFIVQKILEAGADPDGSSKGKTALQVAEDKKNEGVRALLLEAIEKKRVEEDARRKIEEKKKAEEEEARKKSEEQAKKRAEEEEEEARRKEDARRKTEEEAKKRAEEEEEARKKSEEEEKKRAEEERSKQEEARKKSEEEEEEGTQKIIDNVQKEVEEVKQKGEEDEKAKEKNQGGGGETEQIVEEERKKSEKEEQEQEQEQEQEVKEAKKGEEEETGKKAEEEAKKISDHHELVSILEFIEERFGEKEKEKERNAIVVSIMQKKKNGLEAAALVYQEKKPEVFMTLLKLYAGL